VGDILLSVDGQFVQGMPLSALRPMIVGQKGTFVKLGMKRYLPGDEGRTEYTEFTIDLVRGDSMFFCETNHIRKLLRDLNGCRRDLLICERVLVPFQ